VLFGDLCSTLAKYKMKLEYLLMPESEEGPKNNRDISKRHRRWCKRTLVSYI
jgi:membrane glycosyltransferase